MKAFQDEPLQQRLSGGDDVADDRAHEVTGHDAAVDEAEFGSAGNGLDPFAADLLGAFPFPDALEPSPLPEDIIPDQIEVHLSPREIASAQGQSEPTVQSSEAPQIDLSALP